MTTLYEQFMASKKADNFKIRENNLIPQQLTILFEKAYGIDLSGEQDIFSFDSAARGEEISIDYKFQYGKVMVGTESNKLVVTFFHNDKLKVPFETNRCIVTVDDDLNFVKAEYSIYFAFLNSVFYGRNVFGYNQVKIQRIIDLNGSYNHLAFLHDDNGDESFIDVDRSKLDQRFLKPNQDFEDCFYKTIDFVTEKPHEFYEIFDGYPSFSKCVDHSDSIIDFVNVFIQQYFDANERLKENLLLMDMQTI